MTSRREFVDRMVGSAAMLAPLPYVAGHTGSSPPGSLADLEPSEVYDVTNFGADPTGSTDSAAAFEEALRAMPDKGGVLLVPRGRYAVGTSIVWPTVAGSDDALVPALVCGRNASAIKGVPRGWSEGISAVEFSGDGPLFDLRCGTDAKTRFNGGFCDIAIHGSGGPDSVGIEAFRVSSAQFRRVVVRNFGVNLRVRGPSFYSIWENCLFSDAAGNGAEFRGALNGSGFTRTRFASNGGHGLSLKDCGVPVYVDGCWFEGNGSYGLRAVDAVHLRIAGSYFEGNEESAIRFRAVEEAPRAAAVTVMDSYFRPVAGGACLDVGSVPVRLRLMNYVVNGDHGPEAVVRSSASARHSLVATGGERDGETPVGLVAVDPSGFEEAVAVGDGCARDDPRFGTANAYRGCQPLRISDAPIELPTFTDEDRPAAGRAGSVVFNTDDGNLNVDTGSEWVLPNGDPA